MIHLLLIMYNDTLNLHCLFSLLLFTDNKEPKKEKENVMQIVGSAAATSSSVASTTANKPMSDIEKKQESWGVIDKGVSSNVYANGSSQNVGNVITDRPSSRVTQPPGGKSSISFC